MLFGEGLKVLPGTRKRGRTISIPPLSGSVTRIQTIKDQSFQVHAARLFNALPRAFRDITSSLESFKYALDSFLESVPDQPKTDDLIPEAVDDTGKPSNGLICWTRQRTDILTWKIPLQENNLCLQSDDSNEENCYCELCS